MCHTIAIYSIIIAGKCDVRDQLSIRPRTPETTADPKIADLWPRCTPPHLALLRRFARYEARRTLHGCCDSPPAVDKETSCPVS